MTTTEQAEQVRTGGVDTSGLPVGAALRARREQLGWSLPDIAAWLRIKLSYLEALEGGQVSKLPGNAYALGFLRAYSGVLGLDAEDMSRRFRHESKDINRRPELAFPAPVPERGVPAGAVVLLGVLVVVGAYVGWYEFTGHEHNRPHAVPPVPATLLPYAGTGVAPTASPQVATVMPGPGQTPSPLPPAPAPAQEPAPATTVPGAVVPPGPVVQAPTVVASTGPASAVPGPPVLPVQPSAGPPVTGPAPPVTPGAAGPVAAVVPGQITVKATATCWVQVRQVGGKVIYDHVLQAGDSWTVPDGTGPVVLTTGNAGGITLSADGTTSSVLGRNGAVRRNIPLTAASIRDGSVAVEAPTAVKAPAGADAPSSSTPGPRPDAASHPAARAVPPRPAPVRPPVDGSADSLNARQLHGVSPTH